MRRGTFASASLMPVVGTATDERRHLALFQKLPAIRPIRIGSTVNPSSARGQDDEWACGGLVRWQRHYEWASSGCSYQRIRSPTFARTFHRRDFGARSMASVIASMLARICAMR